MSWSASPHRVPPAISMMSFGARSIRSAERVRPKVIKLIPSERHRSLVRVGLLVYDVVVMGANVKSVCVRACVRACVLCGSTRGSGVSGVYVVLWYRIILMSI